MREVEFLPDWYPKVRQRKRVLALQAWITLILVCGLGLWMVLVQRNVQAKEIRLGLLGSDLSESELEVHRLEELLQMQRQLGQQDQIFAKIGRPVEPTRLITTLEEMMPKDMALLGLNLETEDPPKAPPPPLYGRGAQPAEQRQQEPKLKFRLHGVAPTDVDLAEFIARLTSKSFFRQVELLYTHQRVDAGHVMREFEVSFVLDGNPAAPAAPAAAAANGGGR